MTALAGRQRAFLASIRGATPLPASLARYREQAFAGWHAALADAYPVVARLVGPAFFAEAARAYAEAFPSSSGDLHRYGADFAAFLAGYPHAAALPWLRDMARLEWALHRAQFAADAAAFDAGALAAVPAERQGDIVLVPAPAVAVLRSEWPLVAWWEANQEPRDGTPDEGAAATAGVLVARSEGVPRPHPLDAAEAIALEAWSAGADLSSVAQRLGAEGDRLPAMLPRLFALGAFAGVRLG